VSTDKDVRAIYDEETPLGLLRMTLHNDELVEMTFLKQEERQYPRHPVLARQINDYFTNRKPFDFPVRFERGTPFQLKVWRAMMTIPFGETRTYQDIAMQIGNPKALQAVGQACKRNPVGLVVPCHRVIGSKGEMRGYSGPEHIGLKRLLLDHEQGGK